MTWLFERPFPIIVIGGICLALLTAALVQTGKRWLMVALAMVALLTGGLVFLERAIVTDREQVEAVLFDIADALEKNDVDTVVSHISSNCQELQNEAGAVMGSVTISAVRIKNNLKIVVEEDRDPPLAVAEFNVVIEGSDRAGFAGQLAYRRFFQVTFRLEEDGQWRIVGYEDLDPVQHD